MKITAEQIVQGEDEVIVRYRCMTPEIESLLEQLRAGQPRLIGLCRGEQVVVDPAQIIYIESVDGRTFVYTRKDTVQVEQTLTQLGQLLQGVNFFRCSKSMILNINRVTALKSLACNRIDATMCTGEHIMISRTYASEFRRRLKGGSGDA